MRTSLFCFVFLLSACSALNLRPVIGIVSQPTTSPYGSDYIAASYVKYIESAGGRVVPIPYDISSTQIDDLLSGLNGVLFPGGGASLEADSKFFQTEAHIFQKIIEANDNGEHVPLWGTCLGFESLNIIVSGDHGLLSGVDSENLTLALELTGEASDSKMFSTAPSSVVATLTQHAVTLNNHVWGVTPEAFENNAKLSAFFDVLSLNADRKNKTFISTIEGKKYPVYGTQWHPEKNQFEWNNLEDIAHSPDAVDAMQYMANFLVNEARKNTRHYATEAVLHRRIIYNYNPVFTGVDTDPNSSFEQSYYNIKYH